MYRIGFAVLCFVLLACGGSNDADSGNSKGGGSAARTEMSPYFKTAELPYRLTDTGLVNNRDTTSIPATFFTGRVPDSTIKKLFGRTTGVRYTPLAKFESDGSNAYYVVKGTAGEKRAALVMVYNSEGSYAAAAPFLVPDNNAVTSQATVMDKSYVITKTTTQRSEAGGGEGREVVSYDAAQQKFSLIMTDMLNDNQLGLENPLDTFPATHRLAGDYYLNKNNLIAVRDGRYANQILVYINTRNSGGDCRGELKAEFLLAGSNTAVYRQGGDPCSLTLSFKDNAVSINEESGCGNYRGLDCPFGGTFTRKKEEKPKEATKKPKQAKTAR
jgi:hypothetical protein